MTIEECKAVLNSEAESLKKGSGKLTRFSETGPIGIRVARALFATIEAQDVRIRELERRLSGGGAGEA